MFIKKQPILYTLLGLLFFILDRTLKYLFHNSILTDSCLFAYTKNLGIAFGIPLPNIFLIPSIFLVLALLLLYLIKSYQQEKYLTFLSLWLIILGASSNIIDRIKYNFVIDYIDFKFWPIFNIADMLIVIGIILIFSLYLKKPTNPQL